MEAISSTAPVSLPPEADNCDEVYVNQSILFSDSLKDLKDLRKQLYSAAEYFELSYTNDDQKDMVVKTLKEYAVKAFINTVDHLGSVSYKVNDLLDEKVDEVSGTELRVSCIEQRLRSCQEHIGREGLLQQSLVINIPKYHKRYILPVGDTMSVANGVNSTYRGCSLDDEDDWRQFKSSVRATVGGTPPSTVGKQYSPSPSPRLAQQNGSYPFAVATHKKESEKQTVTPRRFPLLRSGSLTSRSSTPKKSRSTTPNPSRPFTRNFSSVEKQKPLEDQKSASVRFNAERTHPKDTERNHPSKGKRLLQALLSRRKSKQDDMLYTYLDEY